MPNILYVSHDDYDTILNLDHVTSIQRKRDRIIIHFHHPEESFTILDDKDEFHIINDYFESLRKDRLRLTNFIDKNKKTYNKYDEEDKDEFISE